MAKVVAGFASSHAATVAEPTEWDRGRAANRASYKRRYGTEPTIHPKALGETMEIREQRYSRIRQGLEFLRRKLHEKKLDALILVGDDQDENFSEENWPQLAVYLGGEVFSTKRTEGKRERGPLYRCHTALATSLLHGLVSRGFDLSYSKSFADSELKSHAHCQILDRILPEADIPLVPFFVNATHPPIISPARCYEVGRAIREVIEEQGSGDRIAVLASGGISHFPAGFPWKFYNGPFTYGSISEEFDRRIMDYMAQGDGQKLADFTSEDFLGNGNDEMRSWVILLGAMGETRPQLLVYDAFYSAGTAMGVGYWDLENPVGREQHIDLGRSTEEVTASDSR